MVKTLKNNWQLFLLFAVSLITIWPILVPGYFSHHDDLQVIRIFEMRECFKDLQLPCRWSANMGYGWGLPLFNYYNPFVYYLGALFSYLVGFVWSAKLLFLFSLFLGPFAVYFLAKEIWNSWAGLVAGILYMFAPYRALDAYVRGAVSELSAISLMPLLFLFIIRIVKYRNRTDFGIFGLLIGIILITHNVSVVLWLPFVSIWSLYWLIYDKKIQSIKLLVLGLIIGFGLSAFFIIPAFMERNLVSTEALTSGDLDYHAHFSSLKQLFFDRFWGYGASRLGPKDDLSMQVGWPHWWVLIFSVGLLVSRLVKMRRREGVSFYGIAIILLVISLLSIFMTHNKSTFIWESFGVLKYIQFPWRYLGVAIFSISLLGGWVVYFFTVKFNGVDLNYLEDGKLVGVVIILLSVLFNFSYFKPEVFYFDINDQKKLTGDLWEEQQKGAMLDYLPKTAAPQKESAFEPRVLEGQINNLSFRKNSNSWHIQFTTSEKTKLVLPILNFPNWKLVDGKASIETDLWGRVILLVDPQSGRKEEFYIKGIFVNTKIRTISNLISLGSFFVLGFLAVYGKNRKIFR